MLWYSPHKKVWNILEIVFSGVTGNEMYCTPLQSVSSSFCLSMLSHLSPRSQFKSWDGRVTKKCTKSGLNNTIPFGRNTTIQLNQYDIPNDNFNQYPCGLLCWDQIWHIFFVTPPSRKGNISALQLAIVTNTVAFKSIETAHCNGVYYTLISK